jgi:hypothetical protein
MKAKLYDFTGSRSFRIIQAVALASSCSARRAFLIRVFTLKARH